MKQRGVVRLLLLSVITLGIYQIFWLKWTRDELVAKGNKIPPVWILFAPLVFFFGFLLVGPPLVSKNTDWFDLTGVISFHIVSVLTVVSLVGIGLYWFYQYCRAGEKATGGTMGFIVSYLLFIVLASTSFSIIWPLIIQDYFNKAGDKTPPAGQPPTPPQDPPARPPSSTVSSSGGPILYQR